MKRPTTVVVLLVGLVIIGLAAGGYALYYAWWNARQWNATHYVVERSEYHAPPARDDVQLADDILTEKNPAFDETLVDSRPIGDWQINASAAVVRLDCPMVKPDLEPAMLVLRPSYRDAMQAAKQRHSDLLPSANMLDGAAKKFDDGLYATIDLACFRGELGFAPAAPDWAAAVLAQLPQTSRARPFLAAALELAGKGAELTAADRAAKERWLAEFAQNKAASQPISFYDWSPELKQVWRFFRFLQHEFSQNDLAIPRDVAAVLKGNAQLREQYHAITAFYGRLTNPLICLPVDALIDTRESLPELAKQHGARRSSVAVFPPSTSREAELFDRMFPLGVPPHVNLMAVLIGRIRLGQVDLKPGQQAGWYQYQVYALETLLLPAKGQEKDKLLLTAAYKKRLIEAFKAMITKRRETHVRQLAEGKSMAAAMPLREREVRPRLRVEPCATFYLRTARAYAFLETFLRATAGPERLKSLHGLRQGGQRPLSLDAELSAIGRRFYGFYLLACEDIGMKPQLLDGEPVDQQAAKQEAIRWLDGMESDADLACDTRVAVPIYVDPIQGRVRIWASLGVRLAHLEAEYARPPRVRPLVSGGPWKDVERYQLGDSRFVIAVDEFAEIELARSNVLTRDELRDACDRWQTKEEIVRGLTRR